MADIYVKMAGVDESSSKCREARRRRIEMRRFSTVAGEATEVSVSPKGTRRMREEETTDFLSVEKRSRSAGSDALPPPPAKSNSSSSSGGAGGGTDVPAIASSSRSPPAAAVDLPVAFGSVAISGRSREMEDAVSVRPGFFRPIGGSSLHFFAVFDGHGGSHVAKLCKERMHAILAEELEGMGASDGIEEEAWSSAVKRSFARMDEIALASCACGRIGHLPCACGRSGFESEIVGSTAVVAVVGKGRLLVANCGDSRAVLSRGGRAVAVSSDHKPDRRDELARIEAAGGRVIYVNGARVDGILAMSRALGDKYFKPVVISEPEICIMDRHPQDECLIIASDGLWDVLPNDLACNVARRCLEDLRGGTGEIATKEAEEQPPEARCSLAAALLARLALGRKSSDNISVIVIDLKRE